MGKEFISHSSKDKIYELLVSFLTSIGISPNNIFCSSLEGNGVKNGKRINSEIKKELLEADIIIYLVSNNFLNSMYCTQELGTIWQLGDNNLNYFIFKFDDVSDDEFKGFIDTSYKYSLVNTDGLSSLYDSLDELYSLSLKHAVITRAINKFLEESKKEISLMVEQKDKTIEDIEKEKILKLRNQFDTLSPRELQIIAYIYCCGEGVGYYGISDGTIGLLKAKNFVFMTSNVSTGFHQFPYALQPWVNDYIHENEELKNNLIKLYKNDKSGYGEDAFRGYMPY